jgi:hypothetical protein
MQNLQETRVVLCYKQKFILISDHVYVPAADQRKHMELSNACL